MFNLQLDSLIFFRAHLFIFWYFLGTATAIVLLKHGRERLREKEQIRLLLETRSRQEDPNDDSEDKSRWQRFKEWCGRNKVYISTGILATIAVLSAILLYQGYNEISAPTLPPETMLESYLGKPSSLRETRDGLLAEDFFFAESTEPRKMGGKDFFDKEKLVLSRIFEMLDFYRQDPPAEYQVIAALRTMEKFLKSDVERWSLGELLHLQMQPHTSYAVIGYHSSLFGDWDDVSPEFKALFNFLTQSTGEGPHRQALEAFDVLRLDFITKVDRILADA